MMKPKSPNEHEEGMLEYLEDIIGSNTFKEPIEEMSKQVEELNDQRGEKVSGFFFGFFCHLCLLPSSYSKTDS